MESWLSISKNGEIVRNIMVDSHIERRCGLSIDGVEVTSNELFHDKLHNQIIIGSDYYDHRTPINAFNGERLELIFTKE